MALYKRTRSTRLLMVALVTTSLLTITVDFRGGDSGPLDAAGRAMLNVITPMQRAVSHVLDPVGNFFSTVGKLGSLRAQNEQLRQEVAELTAQMGTLASQARRIKELEALLDIRGAVPGRWKGARVIASGVTNFEWTVVIDRGARDGIERDMPVTSPAGLVGRVVEVATASSVVELIIDPDSRVAARLSNANEVGLLRGQRDNDLRMQLVSGTVEVEPGETVETAGYRIGDYRGLYPPHIPIGVVSLVKDDPAALSKEVWVRPNADFANLQYVDVYLGA